MSVLTEACNSISLGFALEHGKRKMWERNMRRADDLRHGAHNGDGITLLTAYALHLDPNNPLAGMPVPILDSTTMSMTFYGAAQGVTYGAETSIDCQNWVTAGVPISGLDPANMRTVTVERDSTMRYLRLTFRMGP